MSISDYQTGTLTLRAYHNDNGAGAAEFAIMGVDADELDAILALFPKSAKFRPSTLSGVLPNQERLGYSSVYIALKANAVNGGTNETGVKRIKSILAAAERAGLVFEYVAAYSNSYATLDEFLAAI